MMQYTKAFTLIGATHHFPRLIGSYGLFFVLQHTNYTLNKANMSFIKIHYKLKSLEIQ